MAPKLMALIKWCGGADDKKYTSGIPIEWIKGFNLENFKSDDFDSSETFVVEWRKKTKEPAGGWDVYDGIVIAVSTKLSVLEHKLAAIEGIRSPLKSITEATNHEKEINVDQTLNKKRKASEGDASNRKSPVLNEDTSGDDVSTISDCLQFTPTNMRARLYTADHPEVGGACERALSEIRKELKLLRKHRRHRDDDSSDSSEDEMKEIGCKNSGIFVNSDHWDSAKRSSSFTAMGVSLMMSLFDMKVLLKSNLRGGKSTVANGRDIQKNEALDPKVLKALFYSVRRHWKKDFNAGRLGEALNKKLAILRRENRIRTRQEDIEED